VAIEQAIHLLAPWRTLLSDRDVRDILLRETVEDVEFA
jgi:hypothetical protein